MKRWRIWVALAILAYMGLDLLVWRPLVSRSGPVVSNQTSVPPVPTLHPDTVAQGEALYQQHCAACHGAQLQGASTGKSRWPTAPIRHRPTIVPATPGTILTSFYLTSPPMAAIRPPIPKCRLLKIN